MEKVQVASKILLSLALIYFSTAMIMITVEARNTREAIPEILENIDRIKVDTEIPKILAQLSEITKEISLVRLEIPAILLEVSASRKAIPPVLEQIDRINRHIPEILRQVEETRKIIPPILQEAAAIREELPLSLDKAQTIVNDAQEISIVSGVTTDIVTTPLKLIRKGVDLTIAR